MISADKLIDNNTEARDIVGSNTDLSYVFDKYGYIYNLSDIDNTYHIRDCYLTSPNKLDRQRNDKMYNLLSCITCFVNEYNDLSNDILTELKSYLIKSCHTECSQLLLSKIHRFAFSRQFPTFDIPTSSNNIELMINDICNCDMRLASLKGRCKFTRTCVVIVTILDVKIEELLMSLNKISDTAMLFLMLIESIKI